MSTDRESRPRFSDVTVAMLGESKLIFIAGQVAEDTALDVTGQTLEILAFIEGLLARAGARREHIVSAHIYLASAEDYVAMNSVWSAWVAPGPAPARATVSSMQTKNPYKVEIEVTAAFTPDRGSARNLNSNVTHREGDSLRDSARVLRLSPTSRFEEIEATLSQAARHLAWLMAK